MVALSVSTSAKSVSPGFKTSPTFFNQVTNVPSSIVSLIFGIPIISAFIEEVSTITVAGAVVVGADSAAGIGTSTVVAGAGVSVRADFPLSSFKRCSYGSPFSPIIAIMLSTGTAFPFSSPIYKSRQSLKSLKSILSSKSSSIVALSVSISAIKPSPGLRTSPTFLSHSATTPSVMVSLILGMVIISAIFLCIGNLIYEVKYFTL